ncbi:fatty acid desaturase family protein [Sorangium sp. So ce887]|uniref:fatty acid desaturase family protein n=1 Tax=Sorangium sp. So ce887 TaxID=3133324 RepID=UPI003F5E44A6
MKHPEWLRQAIAAGRELHYTRQPRIRHNAINLMSLAALICGCGLVGAASESVPVWLYVPVGSVLLGCMLFGLFILVIHECSHEMFVLLADPGRSRALNHRIGWLVGVMLFTDYENHWEKGHLPHHLHPTDPDRDPQNPDPLDGRRLLARMRWLLLPGGALALNPSRRYPVSLPRLGAGLAIWVGLGALGVKLAGFQVPVVMVLSFNVTALLNLIKIAQEHGSGLSREADPYLRTRTYFHATSILTSPFNINYHFEHHASFGVPWYALPTFHRRVLELMPSELHAYYVTRGFRAFCAQLAGRRPLPPAELRSRLEG